MRLLRYRPPLAWRHLLQFLAARAIPGVEAVDGDCYRRVVESAGRWGRIEVRHVPSRDAVALTTSPSELAHVPAVVDAVRRVFDLDADPDVVAAHFASDAVLGPRARRVPGLRVPGAWDPFELGVRAVLGQQVTVKGASTLAGRLVALCGRPIASGHPALTHGFPRPIDLAVADLSGLGVPENRRRSLRHFARAVADGDVTWDAPDLDTRLRALPGFGDWTAQYILMRACHDPDAFPASDLWLRRSAGASTVRDLLARADDWRPWRAYAAMLLWQVDVQ